MRTERIGWIRCGCVLVMALAASGCATWRRAPTVDVSQDDAPGYTAEAQATEQIVLWQVDARGESPQDQQVAGRARDGVQQSLIGEGLRLADAAGDVRVSFTTQVEEFDRAGNYYVFDGRAAGDVRLRDARGSVGRDLVGRIDARARGERKLGEADALEDLADKLSTEIATQALTNSEAIRARTKADRIDVRLSWLRRRVRTDTALAEYATDFVRIVGGLPGVIDCRLIEQNTAAGTASFRVVYLRDAFPQGLVNALVQQPDLKLGRGR